MAYCPKCSAETTSRFCPNCGNDMTAIPPVAAAQQPPITYGTYPATPYGAPPAKPGALWQGIVTLVLSLLVSAFIGLGLTEMGNYDKAEYKLGIYGVMALGALLILPFGIWSLVSNRAAGKVMSAIGLGLWALVLIIAILA